MRKAHNSGRNHLQNIRDYYVGIDQAQAQQIINSITRSYDARGMQRPHSLLQGTDVTGMGLGIPPSISGQGFMGPARIGGMGPMPMGGGMGGGMGGPMGPPGGGWGARAPPQVNPNVPIRLGMDGQVNGGSSGPPPMGGVSGAPPNFSQPPPNFSMPPPNFNQPPPNFGQPPPNFNQPPPNFSQPPPHMQAGAGYGSPMGGGPQGGPPTGGVPNGGMPGAGPPALGGGVPRPLGGAQQSYR